ncbi:MAG: formylglycine-generating enzyme family protein [Limisphaerales bacterium]
MKTKQRFFFIVLVLLAGVHQASAQGTQFFRISGPAVTTITAFNADGTLVWSNALAGTNYTIQTIPSLTGGSNWVDYVQIPVTNSVNTNLIFAFNPPAGMALIPAGSFTMGDIADTNITGDAAPTNVYMSAFYMDTNLVSLSQWQTIYYWATNNGYTFFDAGSGKAANYPVVVEDWYDCVKWSNARSQQAGLVPAYYADAGLTQVYTDGDYPTTVYVNWGANGYRLPTEAEWEKAARGGLSGQRFPWGDTISWSQANYFGNPGYFYDLSGANDFDPAFSGTSPVGTFPANGYGLNDMAGNVLEFCWDWYAAPPYPAGSPYLGGTNPTGPATGNWRVSRGGSWFNQAYYARCAYRSVIYGWYFTDSPYVWLGFRCVRGF